MPQKQRQALWDTADQLYPTFATLLAKIQKMLQDEADNKLGFSPMDLDHVDDDTGDWIDMGQTFPGKGANGEDVLFTLQRRGTAIRIAPKGAKGGKRGTKGTKGGKGEKDNILPTTGKGITEWDPNGCARCGRSTHWAKQCTATKDVLGNPPPEKSQPRRIIKVEEFRT